MRSEHELPERLRVADFGRRRRGQFHLVRFAMSLIATNEPYRRTRARG